MFDNIKELMNARTSLENAQWELAEVETQLEEAKKKLEAAQAELADKEDTIARRDEIVVAIHEQVTRERESILDKYTVREQELHQQLQDTESRLKKVRTYFGDCERQVYCIANLYKSLRAGVSKYAQSNMPADLEIAPEEFEELRMMQESVGLKLHSYKLDDLRRMHEANNKLIEQLLARYEARFIVPTDRVIFQLMTLGIRAELQQNINEMEYGQFNRAQVRLHLSVNKFMKIVSFAHLDAADLLASFASELEILLRETLRYEHEYCARRADFERRQAILGKEAAEEMEEEFPEPDAAE